MSASIRQQVPIAVVGVSALFPGSNDARGFWADILAGTDLITDVPSTHWLVEDYYDPNPKAQDKTYSKRGGFLSPIDFDPLEFGVPPTIVPATDSAQILALILAQKVLDDAAQGQFAKMDRERISVLLGVTSAQELLGNMVSRLQKPVWLKALRESGIPETEAQAICERIASNYVPWQESSFPGLLGNVVAGRIANRFDLRGTNAVTDAACASSLAAVSMGINELQLGQSDLVITGGVDAMNDIFMYMCFSKTPALSPTGDCRPFSDGADGTLLGEGIAMVALKRLADAERDGDRVYAVIKGVGSASDGRANSVYAPLPEGQARSLRRAYEVAGYGAETVELVEAHGTGTKAGDAAEFAGLQLAFGETKRADAQWCALGTVKSQIGHTKAAAGAAGLFKAIMALHHKVLPPTIKVSRPNPKLEIEKSPFYLNTESRPWIRDAAHPRRASVSSFGFGGSNFHVALEEYVPSVSTGKHAWKLRTSPTELVLLQAATPAELVVRCRELAGKAGDLGHLARSTQEAFTFGAYAGVRLCLIASSLSDLCTKLNQAAAAIEKSPGANFSTPTGTHYAAGAVDAGEVAFLFPGQGSQYVGMGAAVAMAFASARSVWDDAAGELFDGERLHDVVFPRPVFTDEDRAAQTGKLTRTEWAQPALGVHSRALAEVLHSVGIRPSCVAGHSFGEVSALHEAGAMSAETLRRVARRRGELMRDASATPGSMVAVAKSLAEVTALLTESKAKVVVANHNAPTQVVLAGATIEIASFEAFLASKGVTAKRLPVATAFHSELVAGSREPFLAFLKGVAVSSPAIDVYGNATAAPYERDPVQVRNALVAQLAEPVRFVDQIEAMYARGVRTFVEVGAGSVLTELVGRILGERPHRAVFLDRKGKHGVTTLHEGLGRLAIAGVPMSLAALWTEYAPASQKPVKKPAMTMAISGANFGSPYPPPGGAKALPPPNPPRPAPQPTQTAPVPPAAAIAPLAIVAPVAPAQAIETMSKFPSPMSEILASPPAQATRVATAATAAATVGAQDGGAWVHAFQETQRHTAEAHASYQQAMAASHIAFLKTAEASYAGLTALLHGRSGVSPAPVLHPPAQSFSSVPAHVTPRLAPAVPPPAPIVQVAAPSPVSAPIPTPMAAPPRSAAAPVAVPNGLHHAAPAVSTPAAAPAAHVDLQALMMTIVAEKTGYPQEMLGTHMELEADLGIDSIKRVEILSAMRERAPGLPEVKPSELAALRTLGQIVDHMNAASGANSHVSPVLQAAQAAQASPATNGAGHAAPASLATAAPAAHVDLHALMMTIVAEKTGYPQEMLGTHMELEADLGIDSIKRVEILSAMRERAPGLPEVKPSELAALRTLGQIVDHMNAASGANSHVSPVLQATQAAQASPVTSGLHQAAPASIATAAPAAHVDLHALMMTIVAEKTGYPQEMLGTHMELEADLGIDSIKRVEILSAMRERAPGLPEVKPSELAALRTLGQIVDHMNAASGANSHVSSVLQAGQASPGTAQATVGRYALREVPCAAVGMALAQVLGARNLVITDEGSGIAELLVNHFKQIGVAARVVDSAPADADGVVFLGGLRGVTSVDQAVAINREAFRCARQVARRFSSEGGVYVSVQDTGGDFGLLGGSSPHGGPNGGPNGGGFSEMRAYLGGVSALTRTAALEWPKASLKAIDCERGTRSPADVALAIFEELLTGGATLEVGLHATGARTTLVSVPTAVQPSSLGNIGPDSIVLASGGGRGVTAAALIALAKAKRPRFVLLGRTALQDEATAYQGLSQETDLKKAVMQTAKADGRMLSPNQLSKEVSQILSNREIRGTLAALKAAGSNARYLAVDVQNAAQLGLALEPIRKEWGPITAIIHGAGVLADKRIDEKTDEQFDRVFDTKIVGMRALLAATAADPITALCFFSSIAARTGNLGQCDYAMANEVLNLVACAERVRRGPGCVVRSLGWGPWEGGMVTPSLKTHFEQMGVVLIPLAVGARMMVEDLTSGGDDTRLVIAGGTGTGLLGASEVPHSTVEMRVDNMSHPYLADHRLAGTAVVPMVLAVEWFLRAARACRPDLVGAAVKDVKVLRGIKLDGFAAAGNHFIVTARQVSNGAGARVAVELRSPSGTLHYTAIVHMTDGYGPLSVPPAAARLPAVGDWNQSKVYDGHVLFHGPSFQVIRSVDGMSREGIIGELSGTRAASWPAEPWLSDAAAFDGGLQLALLWSRHVLGGAVLPMALGEYRSYRDGLIDGPVRCVVHARAIHDSRAVCDIGFTDADGRLLAELLGVETILRPGEPTKAAGPSINAS